MAVLYVNKWMSPEKSLPHTSCRDDEEEEMSFSPHPNPLPQGGEGARVEILKLPCRSW